MTAQQKRQPSEQAQAAKAIKGYARAMGIDCKARSDSFSMGDSVSWTVSDVRPEKFAALESMAARHQYGSFDGMQDLYEYTNRRDDLPQSKYVTGHNVFSPAMMQAAFDWVRANCPGNAARLPADYTSAQSMNWHTGAEHCYHHESVNACVLDVLRGSSQAAHYDWLGFWNQAEGVNSRPETAPVSDHAPASEAVPSMRIEQHAHTKKGFEFFLCVMADRIDRVAFDALLEKARESGGWYSRAWGTTPGGFAFKDRAKAEAFAGGAIVAPAVKGKKVDQIPRAPETKKTAASVTAEQLREQAARLHKNAAACFADRLTNTPKRLGQAMQKRLEGTRDERTARALERLADNLDAGEPLPAWLAGQKAPQVRATLAGLLRYKLEPCRNGYHGYSVETNTPEHDSPEARAAFALLDDTKETARRTESDLKQKIEALRFSRIPGYFPTPAAIVARMLERIEQAAPSRMLEPSAGSGNIADALRAAYPSAELDCIEPHYSLREILAAKGHALAGSDFMALERGDGDYDLIVMNPPFENLQDAAHVMHAFELLAPGGELVAIVSPSVFFRDDGKAYRFRQLFESVNGEREKLPEGSFKQSGTGVDTLLIYMRNPL